MPSSSSTLELPEGMKGKLPSKGLPSALGIFGTAAAPMAKTARETYEVCIMKDLKDRSILSDWEKPRSVEGRKEDLQSGVKGV